MLTLFRKNRGFLDDFFNDFKMIDQNSPSNLMKTDIKETDKGYTLLVELPGYDKNDVKVSLENGYLLIEATTNKEKEEKDIRYIRKERYYGSLKRSYYVGNLSLDDIKGSFDSGILTLEIPKEEEKEPEKRYLDLK